MPAIRRPSLPTVSLKTLRSTGFIHLNNETFDRLNKQSSSEENEAENEHPSNPHHGSNNSPLNGGDFENWRKSEADGLTGGFVRGILISNVFENIFTYQIK